MTQVCCCSCIAIRAGLVPCSGTAACCMDVPALVTPGSGNLRKYTPLCGISLLLNSCVSFHYTVKWEARICDSCILFSAMSLMC